MIWDKYVCVCFNLNNINNDKTVYKQCTDTDYKNQMIQKEYTLAVSEKSPSISLLSPL